MCFILAARAIFLIGAAQDDLKRDIRQWPF
jgi:hypothetical protein